jgi:hypothetical protein
VVIGTKDGDAKPSDKGHQPSSLTAKVARLVAVVCRRLLLYLDGLFLFFSKTRRERPSRPTGWSAVVYFGIGIGDRDTSSGSGHIMSGGVRRSRRRKRAIGVINNIGRIARAAMSTPREAGESGAVALGM